jgi:Protein of unknown function (DUF1579)
VGLLTFAGFFSSPLIPHPDNCQYTSVTSSTGSCSLCARRFNWSTKENDIVLVLAFTSVSFAQVGSSSPSPEVNKLDYFSGNWTIEATVNPGPWGAGGKFISNGTCEWLKGGYFVVSRVEFSMPAELGGDGTALAVFGYDADKKSYTEDRFDSQGRHLITTGTLSGDTWTWSGENNYGGMTIKQRLSMKVTSPNSYTSKYEVSADGDANWMPFWEGKATKK